MYLETGEKKKTFRKYWLTFASDCVVACNVELREKFSATELVPLLDVNMCNFIFTDECQCESTDASSLKYIYIYITI